VKTTIVLSSIGLFALVIAGCSNSGNQLAQPMPGPTPTSAPAPGPNAAGGPLVPGNNANAGSTIPVTPRGEPGGQPLVPPTSNVR
jgi:hypothetical protein